MRTYDATPKASILIESMRDLGYSLETALADIIDNSITAHSKSIQIFVDIEGLQTKIGILDDGDGMTEEQLLTAMRPGSRNPLDEREKKDLGRFGLGLKTASFSQCRRLTVISRQNDVTNAAIWDLDYVVEKDKWLVQIPSITDEVPWSETLGGRGTLVVWEKMDRLTSGTDTSKDSSLLVRRIDEVREHLELVYHRFLSGELGVKKVKLWLNYRQLEPFDPFNSNHPATISDPPEVIKIGRKAIILQTFTLPHHSKVSPAEWDRYAGRPGYVRNQGFYVYREKRLIIHGTWFGLARQMELTKLARIRIDMPNGLDSEWKIDVKKASAQLPVQVRERLRRLIDTIGAGSKRVYKQRGHKLTTDNRLPVWNRIQERDHFVYRLNQEHPVFKNLSLSMSAEARSSFIKTIELFEVSLPYEAIFADMGGAPEKAGAGGMSDESLVHSFRITIDELLKKGLALKTISEMFQTIEPFRSNWKQTEELLNSYNSKGIADV